MHRLILMRHGDAQRDSASGDDFDRPLSNQGCTESAAMGRHLADMGLIPTLSLVSSALRTRQTWAALVESFPSAEVRFEDSLYLADPDTVRDLGLAAVRDQDCVILIGHNPGLQALAVSLLVQASAPVFAIPRAETGFPTGAAAVFFVDSDQNPTYDGIFYPRDIR